jgi:hypothetical protein
MQSQIFPVHNAPIQRLDCGVASHAEGPNYITRLSLHLKLQVLISSNLLSFCLVLQVLQLGKLKGFYVV